MSDPKRFVDEDGFAGSLLASARWEAPSQRARERAAMALGLGVGAAILTSGSIAPGAAAAGKGATVTGGALKAGATGLWFKVLAAPS